MFVDDLSSTSRFRRSEAVRRMGLMRDERALELLVKALSDYSDLVRDNAEYALRQIGTPRAITALRQRSHEP